ncbi:hypothetical protein QR680_001913 [Steinernema hermaphroditum]|uniref:Angiotensin-converting enzyme n=1 Tax=Steinernema hermaphroditum TaxID=289476 RepID=A0AA39H0E2_9BILA|nr:hypothetical protein QR680_001913 [Steinernema hermaphroditum]
MKRLSLILLLISAVACADNKSNETLPIPKPFPEPEPVPEPAANAATVSQAEPLAEPEPNPEPAPEPEPERKPSSNDARPESHSSEHSAARTMKIQFDAPSEDYGDTVDSSKNKPDDIDNDVIQKLVESYLNPEENKPKQRVNKEVEKLINSSPFWNLNEAKAANSIKDEDMAQEWMNGYTNEAQKILYQVAVAGWNYFTNVQPNNKDALDEAEDALALFVKSSSKQAKQFDISKMNNPFLKREFEILTVDGMSALDAEKYGEFNEVNAKINRDFINTEICEFKGQNPCIIKFTDLAAILNNEKDLRKSAALWKFWRETIGPKLSSQYEKLMKLTNEAAQLNGFGNGRDMWLSPFELSSRSSPPKVNIMKSAEKIYEQILPFYQQIHAYMRRQLTAVFKDKSALSKDGAIPAHMLKSVSADNWSGLYQETKPFEENEGHAEEILGSFHRLNYTSKTMFIQAYRYFKYLGFGKLPTSFWKNSVFTRSWSKDMLCNPPAAYDMRDGNDFRVKACSQLGETDFKLAHKLMAQVFYQYQYKKQPLPFRESANPSVQTAIANAFGILSTNYDYLKSADLLADDTVKGEAVRINNLYREALIDFVKLPFDVVADKWRFEVFEGKINSSNWNSEWWKLKTQYQGVKAPFARKNDDFDPIASSAIAQSHSPALRHVVSYVMQFQILKALCGNSHSLDLGCIPDKEVIANVKRVMMQGASINWLEALEQITGDKELDAKPMLDYYAPLISWLSNTNEHDEMYLGWDGPETSFSENDVPAQRTSDEGTEHFIVPSEDQVAYPGGDCSKGQECLLDSTCNGKTCECNPGLFTFKVASSVNCLPGDPGMFGFEHGGSGLSIGLVPNENVSTSAPPAEEHPKAQQNHSKHMHHAKSAPSSTIAALLLPVLAVGFFH